MCIAVAAGLWACSACYDNVRVHHGLRSEVIYLNESPPGFKRLKAWVYTPSAKRDVPMLVYLHGQACRGESLEGIADVGPLSIVEKHGSDIAVVVPLCPAFRSWHPDVIECLIDNVSQRYGGDVKRLYISGYGMGARGAWEYATDYPGRAVGIIPICSSVDPGNRGAHRRLARKMVGTRVWAFHPFVAEGFMSYDAIVSMVEAIRQCGGEAKITDIDRPKEEAWDAERYNSVREWMWE